MLSMLCLSLSLAFVSPPVFRFERGFIVTFYRIGRSMDASLIGGRGTPPNARLRYGFLGKGGLGEFANREGREVDGRRVVVN